MHMYVYTHISVYINIYIEGILTMVSGTYLVVVFEYLDPEAVNLGATRGAASECKWLCPR